MVGPMGGDDLPGRGANRIARQLLYQVLAQAGIAQAVAIAKQGADAGAHDLPGEFVQPHVHQPVHWRKPSPSGEWPGSRTNCWRISHTVSIARA